MIGAKITVAKYCAELKIATAVPPFLRREPVPQRCDCYQWKEGDSAEAHHKAQGEERNDDAKAVEDVDETL